VTRVGWGVVLSGEAFDLEDWQKALTQSFDPWVMKTKEGLLVLRSGELDRAATDSEALNRATPLMEQAKGALAVSHGAGGVRFEALAEVFDDGSCQPHHFAQLRATEAMDRASMVVDGGAEPMPPAPSIPQRWLAIAAEDALLGDALTYFGRGDDWFDAFKARESLIGKFGGGKEADFLALDWASRTKIKLLKQTADSWRHSRRGRLNVVPPDPPMERTEARDLLQRLMVRAFTEAERGQ
jgi:hypothetical protein